MSLSPDAITHAPVPPRITLVGGGTRSGKSRFALELARARGSAGKRVFVATAQAFDAEMHARIRAHEAERGAEFSTLEEPLELVRALRELQGAEVVVIDCITLWLANLLLADHGPERIASRVDELCAQLLQRRWQCVLVTNEVGMGVVPESALGRAFRDLAGLANQRLAAIADELHWAMLGSILRIRPEPLRVHTIGSTA